MTEPIDSRVDIGHVHLKVADIERSLAFYSGVLAFDERLHDRTARRGSDGKRIGA